MYIMVNDVNTFVWQKQEKKIVACNFVMVCCEKNTIYDSMIRKKKSENFEKMLYDDVAI
jgi:hypothetical protein